MLRLWSQFTRIPKQGKAQYVAYLKMVVDGRFDGGILDQVEDVGGPNPAGFALEDRLAQALAVDDTAG